MATLNNSLNMLLYFAATLGYLPLAPYLQLLPRVAVPAAIVFAAMADRRGFELKGKPALILSIACVSFYLLQFNRHNPVEPAANLLAMVLAIRLVGEKTARNFLQTLTLALFCLAASTLFDLSPRFIIYLILLLLTLTISMVLLTFKSRASGYSPGKKELRSIVTIALLQPLFASPLVLIFFFILPRTQLPLWHGLSRVGIDKSGISETVTAGERSSISSGSGVVFRAEMPQQSPNSLYWRTIVLNTIKEESWIRHEPPPEKTQLKGGEELQQNIFLEPGKLPFLPTLNMPVKISGYRSSPHTDRIFPSAGLIGGRRNYQVTSRAGAELVTTGRINRSFYTRLPPDPPQRLNTFVATAVAGLHSDQQRLTALETAFGGMNLYYAASGLPTGPDAVETFIFEVKKGHCELFAISFATAVRLAGIPARLVGGYYGGDYNDLARYYVVTEERAHLWVEVWLEGSGWQSVDPSRFAVNFEEGVFRKRSSYDLRWRLFLDSLSYYWNRMVITYDLESQFNAVSRAGTELKGIKSIKIPARKMVLTIISLLMLSCVVLLLTGRRKTLEERLLHRFKRVILLKYAIHIPASSGLHEAVQGIDNPAVKQFVAIYSAAVYRDRTLTQKEKLLLEGLLQGIARVKNR